MTAALEELDIAEVLAERHKDTPLWNELMSEYDAATLDELGANWPPPIYDTTTFGRPANGDDPGDEPGQPETRPAEEHPPVTAEPPATDPQPDEADPQTAPDTPESEPVSDPAE
jgi:hypothetical protein